MCLNVYIVFFIIKIVTKPLSSIVLSTFALAMLGGCSSDSLGLNVSGYDVLTQNLPEQCGDDDDLYSPNLVVQFNEEILESEITIPHVPKLPEPKSCKKREQIQAMQNP